MKVISNTNVNLVGNQNAIFFTPVRYGLISGKTRTGDWGGGSE